MKQGEFSERSSAWQRHRVSFLSQIASAGNYLNMEIKREDSIILKERAVPIKHLTEESERILVDGFYEGKSDLELADKLSLNKAQIRYLLQKRGLKREIIKSIPINNHQY